MSKRLTCVICLLVGILVVSSSDNVFAQKNTPSAIKRKLTGTEVWIRFPGDLSWFIDTGDPDLGKRYLGPFTREEAEKLVILMGEIPVVCEHAPPECDNARFQHPRRPNIVAYIYYDTFEPWEWREFQQAIGWLSELGLQVDFRGLWTI